MNSSRTDLPRPASAFWLPLLVWTVLGLGGLDIAVRGTSGQRLAYLPWLAWGCWLVWLVLWTPRLRVTASGVEVREILRTYWLPFACITDIRPGAMLRLEYLDAAGRPRVLQPWNGLGARSGGMPQPATLGRGGVPAPSEPDRRHPVETHADAGVSLKRAWLDAEEPAAGELAVATVSWRAWELLITVGLAALALMI